MKCYGLVDGVISDVMQFSKCQCQTAKNANVAFNNVAYSQLHRPPVDAAAAPAEGAAAAAAPAGGEAAAAVVPAAPAGGEAAAAVVPAAAASPAEKAGLGGKKAKNNC